MSDLSHNEQKRLARLLLKNLDSNADLKGRLPSAAVNAAAAFAEGEPLYNTACTLIDDQDKLTQEVNNMWQGMHGLHETAWKTFSNRHREWALELLAERPDLRTMLDLRDKLAHGRPDQLNQMRTFYTRAVANEEVLELLAEVALTAEKLEKCCKVIAEMDDLEDEIRIKEALKQDTTARQDKALELLNEWRLRLWKRIEIVTEDAPRLRKAVGMTVSDGTRKRGEADEAEESTEELEDLTPLH